MSSSPFPPGSLLVAYLRDSGGEEQDLSIDQQEAALRAWATTQGCTITQFFRDTRSGTSTIGRTGFEAMIKYFFQRSVRHKIPEAGLLLWRYNRFARDLDDAQYFKAGLRRRGFTIHSLQDPIPDGPAGRILEFFIDWMADKFSSDLAVDVQRGVHHLVEQHGALGGTPPRGFIRQPIDLGDHRHGLPHIVHRWVPDPATWETCRLAWQLRASGAPYTTIQQRTHLFGSINSYATFFRNPIYLGELHYGDQVITGYCEPLVDRATWDAVQKLSARRTKSTNPDNPDSPRRVASAYLLSGLVRCAVCGRLLSGNTVRPRNEAHVRGYYLCPGARTGCSSARIPRQALEDAVITETVSHIVTPEILAQLQAERDLRRTEEAGQHQARLAELSTQLQSIRQRITNISDAIAEAGHSRSLLARLSDLERQEQDAVDEVRRIKTLLQSPESEMNPETFAKFSRSFTTILRTADSDTQKRILRGLIEKITVQRHGRILTGAIHYYQLPDDYIQQIADLPLDDTSSSMYANAPPLSGGTLRMHTFTAQIPRRKKTHIK